MNFLKVVLAMMAALFVPASAFADGVRAGTYTPVSEPPASAQVVTVGFYPVSFYEVNMGSSTYNLATYIWMRWKGPIDPSKTVEFTNLVEEWSKIQEPLLPEPEVLADGSHYQFWRIEGRFFQPFSLAKFPLDRQKLSLRIEDTASGADKLFYVIDSSNSGIGASVDIPGWKLLGWNAQSYSHDYGTNFGTLKDASSYSAMEFTTEIVRPLSFFIWKLLLPLFIVLCASVSGLLIRPQALDARTGLPAGALLTAIFLQKSYSDILPDLGYMVLMDKIYLVSYSLTALVLIRSITVHRAASEGDKAVVERIQRTDRFIFVAIIFAFLLATAGLVYIN